MTKAQLWNLKKNKRNIHQESLTYKDKEIEDLKYKILSLEIRVSKYIYKYHDELAKNYNLVKALNSIKWIVNNSLGVFRIKQTKKEILAEIEKAINQ